MKFQPSLWNFSDPKDVVDSVQTTKRQNAFSMARSFLILSNWKTNLVNSVEPSVEQAPPPETQPDIVIEEIPPVVKPDTPKKHVHFADEDGGTLCNVKVYKHHHKHRSHHHNHDKDQDNVQQDHDNNHREDHNHEKDHHKHHNDHKDHHKHEKDQHEHDMDHHKHHHDHKDHHRHDHDREKDHHDHDNDHHKHHHDHTKPHKPRYSVSIDCVKNNITHYNMVYNETQLLVNFVSVVAFGVAAGKTIFGAIAVRNIIHEKTVFVRMTFNQWESFEDVPAKFCQQEYGGKVDRFFFNVPFDNSIFESIKDDIEFAVCFQIFGEEFWDNNGGTNYKITSRNIKK